MIIFDPDPLILSDIFANGEVLKVGEYIWTKYGNRDIIGVISGFINNTDEWTVVIIKIHNGVYVRRNYQHPYGKDIGSIATEEEAMIWRLSL